MNILDQIVLEKKNLNKYLKQKNFILKKTLRKKVYLEILFCKK
jgi:hypothetical protein